jgi:hypothetical protein
MSSRREEEANQSSGSSRRNGVTAAVHLIKKLLSLHLLLLLLPLSLVLMITLVQLVLQDIAHRHELNPSLLLCPAHPWPYPDPSALSIHPIFATEKAPATLPIGRVPSNQDTIGLQDLIWLLLLRLDQIEIDEDTSQATHREVDKKGERVTDELDQGKEEKIGKELSAVGDEDRECHGATTNDCWEEFALEEPRDRTEADRVTSGDE